MPGPNTLCNLYEFFWKDGFGRIHEIQVRLTRLFYFVRARDYSNLRFSPLTKHCSGHRVASTAARHRRAAFPLLRKGRGSGGSPVPSPSPGWRFLAVLFRWGADLYAAWEPCRHPAARFPPLPPPPRRQPRSRSSPPSHRYAYFELLGRCLRLGKIF